MQAVNGSVLIVDDDPDAAMLLRDHLRRRGLDASDVHSADAALARMADGVPDVVVTDVRMPGMSGIELCAKIRDEFPGVLPIIVTAWGDLDTAIAAIRAGAFDYIAKPVSSDSLALAVSRAIHTLSLRREVGRLRAAVRIDEPSMIIGECPAIHDTLELIRRVSDSDATVLVLGESGTGKELVARALHDLSPRRDEPFIALNCAAMPAPLLESELFGHVRGAFTDAKQSRRGLFVQAKSGTIFLDEVAEMPLDMQAKLLRALQERTVRPVGSDEEVPFQARVVTATNRDLEREVRRKRFREDLFYRINVVAIPMPPLRERGGDVLLLAQWFLRRSATRNNKEVEGISPPAAELLVNYDWPGNVRELENCMERAVALCRLDQVTVDDLPKKVREHGIKHEIGVGNAPNELITLDEMERRYIRHVLEMLKGNKTRAARTLGIDRRSLYRRLETFEDEPPPAPAPPPIEESSR